MKRTRSIILAAILLLSTMVVFVTPAVAQGSINLWVVPGDPDATRYVGTNPDEILQDTLIADTFMDTTFSCDVLVLNRDTNSAAIDVDLKVFVRDATNIADIEIGTAKLVVDGSIANADNSNQGSPTVTTFTAIVKGEESRPFLYPGWLVVYPIGDIPEYANDKYGNPDPEDGEGGIDDFHPEQAKCYITVPITINFIEPPEQGFIIYAYAENPDNDVKTVWSHDAAFYNIPEFATIAIPAIALLGLFAFYRRKQKK